MVVCTPMGRVNTDIFQANRLKNHRTTWALVIVAVLQMAKTDYDLETGGFVGRRYGTGCARIIASSDEHGDGGGMIKRD